MAENAAGAGSTASELQSPPRRVMISALLRSLLSGVVVVVIYFQIPLSHLSESRSVIEFVIELAVVSIILVVQAWLVLRSPYPLVRTVEALSTTLPLFVVVFAITHFELSSLQPGSYTQSMSRLDSLYFTVATFATVGFGDIAPVSQPARLVALLQMVLGLILVGLVARVITGAAQLGKARRRGPSAPS